jgi:Periplasmic copper-binding protein (NosD)
MLPNILSRNLSNQAGWFALAIISLVTACTTTGGNRVPPLPSIAPYAGSPVAPRLYYVDGQIRQSPCTAYDPSTRSCGAGRELAFNDLDAANNMAQAGDVIVLRGGLYSSPIRPAASGTLQAPIKYVGQSDEVAAVTVQDEPAIQLKSVQHITISGLVFRDSLGWGRLEDAHYNSISANKFIEALARGTTGGLKLVRSHFNRLEKNSFYRGNDSIVLQESDHNLVAANHLEFARHSLLSIRCSNFNVIRGNYLHNARQKAAEIYDCEGISDAPMRFDATKRNLFEGNNFAHVTGSSRPDKYNGIQYSQQLGIVRSNLFTDNEGGAIHFAVYEQEALYNYGNRVYANRFVANRCQAVSGATGTPMRVGDNRVFGNLLSGNTDCYGSPDNKPRATIFTSDENIDARSGEDDLPLIWHARAQTSGTGRVMEVNDVLPLFDGFAIPGEVGDGLEFENSGETARLQQIDYAARTLQFDRDLDWTAGSGIRISRQSLPDPRKALPMPAIRQ